MKDNKNYILKGDIVYSKDVDTIITKSNSYLICKNSKSMGVFNEIPEEYKDFEVLDYTGKIIIPGLIDLHTHASQYAFRGVGMDLELLDWLNTHTFTEEAKFKDLNYAKEAYDKFTKDLKNSATTRAVIYSTIHKKATQYLMDNLEQTKLITMVGKVNMDYESPKYLIESTQESIEETKDWILESVDKYKNVKPIITPRFVPTCSTDLLRELGKIARENNICVQSHLSENKSEIKVVMDRYRDSLCYADVYRGFNLLGSDKYPSVMAHCVHSDETELKMLKDNNTFIAHCPQSNMNLYSGVSPAKKILSMGINVGLGTDLSGGSNISIMRCAVDAILASKILYTLKDEKFGFLNIANAFYMATLGGGKFFGKVGSFEKGYEFDAVVIDDNEFENHCGLNLEERLERAFYLSADSNVIAKFAKGDKVI